MKFTIPQEIIDLNPRIVLLKDGQKGPKEKGWPNTKRRVLDLISVFGANVDVEGHSGYGIVLDADTVVVDIDNHPSNEPESSGRPTGQDMLDKCKADGFDLEAECNFIVTSPSGGKHLYFSKRENLKLPGYLRDYQVDFLQVGKMVVGPGSNYWNGTGTYELAKAGPLSPLPGEVEKRLQYGDFADTQTEDEFRMEEQIKDHVRNEGRSVHDSPRSQFDIDEGAVQIIADELKSAGYTVNRKGDGTFVFVRPGKVVNQYSEFKISGTLGRKNSNGRPYLKSFSTSDGILGDEAMSLSHALKKIRRLDDAGLLAMLEDMGFKRQPAPWDDIDWSSFTTKKAEEVDAKRKEASIEKQLEGFIVDRDNPTFSLRQLAGEAGVVERRPYLLEGLLRECEVMNVIAAPKVGKSWLVYNLALAASAGKTVLGFKATRKLRVLIADNELHREELSWRLVEVAKALNVSLDSSVEVVFLRGTDVDVDGLDAKLRQSGGEKFDIIVVDALYRVLRKGTSENSNSDMTSVYNKLDEIAKTNNAAIVVVHHSSKGNQGDKGVTDVGAGAGAISRAADTHMAIRQHKEEGLFVIDAVTRSGMSPDPRSAKFDWPVWKDVAVDPVVLDANAKSGLPKDQKLLNCKKDVYAYMGTVSNGMTVERVQKGLLTHDKSTVQLAIKELFSDEGLLRKMPTSQTEKDVYAVKLGASVPAYLK